MLRRMPQNPQEAPPIVPGDERYREISRAATICDNCQKSSKWIVPCTSSREKQGRRRGQRNCRGRNQAPCTPMLKHLEELREPALLEFLVEVSRASGSRQSESQICANNRSCRCRGGVLPPKWPMTCRKYRGEDIGATKSGYRRAIEYRQEEKARRSQMLQRGEQRRMAARFTNRGEQTQHACTISIRPE